MRRREFITLLSGAAAAWPLAARAQKIPLIAWLDGGGQPRPDSLVAFRSGLNNRGYVDGRNVVIGIHGVEQPEELSEAITDARVGGGDLCQCKLESGQRGQGGDL